MVIRSKKLKPIDLRTTLSKSVGREKGHVCICILTCEHASDLDLLIYRMNGTSHYACMGCRCRYRWMEKTPRVILTSHLEWVEAFILGILKGISNNCLRFGSNHALLFLLTLLGDPVWSYKVREHHPKTRLFSFFGTCCLYQCEPMEMNLAWLVDYLIDVGPCGQSPTPGTEDETPPTQ